MSITYKYFNATAEMTAQQANNYDYNYRQREYVNGVWKRYYIYDKEKKIRGGGGGIFLEQNQEITPELIQQYCLDNNWFWKFHKKVQTAGEYTLWEIFTYSEEGIYAHRSKEVLRLDGQNIAYIMYKDLTTDDIHFCNKRHFFTDPETGQETFVRFNYHKDTLAAKSFGSPEHWDFVYGGAPIDKMYEPKVMRDFIYDDHPYYHNLLPLLPPNGII